MSEPGLGEEQWRRAMRWLLRGLAWLFGATLALALVTAVYVHHFVMPLNRLVHISTKSKTGECRTNLRHAYVSQRVLWAEEMRLSSNPDELGFSPEPGNRYAYFFAKTGALRDWRLKSRTDLPSYAGVQSDVSKWGPSAAVSVEELPTTFAGGVELGITGACQPTATDSPGGRDWTPPCWTTVVCARRVPELGGRLDVWSVSSRWRVTSAGEEIAPGVPYRETPEVDEH